MIKGLHVSWLIAWFSLSLIIGIALTLADSDLAFVSIQWLLLAVGLMSIALLRPVKLAVILAVAAGTFTGLWRGESVKAATTDFRPLIGQQLILQGTIEDDVTHKNGVAGLKLNHVKVNGHNVNGKIWAGVGTAGVLKRDDLVWLNGKLSGGFGNYSASISYAKLLKMERPEHADPSRELRDNFAAGLNKAVPPTAASLGMGYLVGQHNGLPTELYQQLCFTGLIHIVIAGGYNVTIMVRFLRRRLMKHSRYLALISALGVLLGMAAITGFCAPMSRTLLVTSLGLIAWYYGRAVQPLVVLPVAAAITAWIEPSFVWGDVGWYMTFIAYGGLIIIGPGLKNLLWSDQPEGELKQIIVDTFSVQLAATPLMAFALGQYSIYGLPANLLVLPFMPLTIIATVVAGLSGMFLPAPLAHILGWPASILLDYVTKIAGFFAGAPGAKYAGNLSLAGMVASYLLLFVIVRILLRKSGYHLNSYVAT